MIYLELTKVSFIDLIMDTGQIRLSPDALAVIYDHIKKTALKTPEDGGYSLDIKDLIYTWDEYRSTTDLTECYEGRTPITLRQQNFTVLAIPGTTRYVIRAI